MAPILSFTAEEIWQLLGKDADDSVMLHLPRPARPGRRRRPARPKWTTIRAIRADVQKEIEAVRCRPGGSSLQAEVEIRAAGGRYDLLASLGDDLRFVLICSKTTLVQVAADEADAGDRRHPVRPRQKMRPLLALPRRCRPRCRPSELCGRCTSNLHGAGEARSAA